MVVKQFEVYLVSLDPTKGSEIRKTRPCVVISPNEMNDFLNTVLVIPLTSTKRAYPTRVDCTFENKEGQVAIDQMRAVDKIRLVKKLGHFKDKTFMQDVMNVLQKMFSL
ncbi:MAG: death on curing protein [Flavipsychrobacter sp.]|nr:death on curing protein [Flavipsychrobacter sp.]